MTEEAAPAPSIGRCIYGFALFILSITCLVLYITWSIIPSSYLTALGLGYFSSKYWAIAIPTTVCTLIGFFATLLYPSINMILTPPPDSISTITDRHSRKPVDQTCPHKDQTCPRKDQTCPRNVEELMETGIPSIWDMDIEHVNDLLYNKTIL